MIKIVVESHIPYIKGLLEPMARVEYLDTCDITAAAVRDADALLVRTRTRCDASLLEGSRVRFIGTATIGTDHIDLDFILQVYQDRFADLSDMSVFVVGDFDPDSLKTLVVKYIATLPGKGRVEKPVDIGYRLFDSSKTLRFTAKMAEPQDKVYFFWTTQVDYTLKNYLTAQVAGRILSDMWLDDLRGKHGWTKHIDSHCSVVDTDGGPAIYFPFNATVTAGKGEAARQLVLGDLERVARGNVTAAQLKAQQDYYSRVHKENMGTNGYWMQMLQNYVLNDGLDFDGP